MLPDGTCVLKDHGIPSGSMFTQLIGSFVNMIANQFIFNLLDIKVLQSRFLGDDSLIIIPKESASRFNVKKVVWIAKTYLNLTINQKKIRVQRTTGEIKFLGYNMKGYRLFRDELEYFRAALYPESRIGFLERSSSRVFAYYLLGGCNTEKFSSFCKYFFNCYRL